MSSKIPVYRFANIGEEVKRAINKEISNISYKKNYACVRCLKCNLLFYSLRLYQRKICILCKFESCKEAENAIKKTHAKLYGNFNKDEFYDLQIKKHIELQDRKNNLNKALKVKVLNEPKCERVKD